MSSSIAHIKKLSDSNWHTWEPTFIDCLQRVRNAKEIMYGTIAPGSEEYDEDLDKALVGLIHTCCDHSPDSRIDTYTVRGADEEVQLGSTLYAKLKKALTLNDAVKRVGLQDRIHTVCLHNWDVVKPGKELDSIWNDTACLGKRFDEDLKKSTLYRCTGQDWFYANSVDALKTAKPDCKYNKAYHALAKKQQDGEVSGCIRGAARVAASTEQWDTNQVGQRSKAIGGDKRLACNTWIVDSGATHHMVNDERMLLTWASKVGQISTAGDKRLQVKAIGDTSLQIGDATIQLLDVLYVPKLNANLLSVQGLIENGARVIFDEFGTTIKQNDGTQIQYRRNRKQGQFEVQGQALALESEETLNDIPEGDWNTGSQDDVPEDNQNTGNRDSNSKEDKDIYLWHERFGHPGRDKTRQIRKHYLGTDERMEHESKHCSACSQGKQTRARMGPSETRRAEAPLELVHIDLMTDFKGHANYHYALVAVDDFSSLICVKPLCTKGAALSALRRWITRMERTTDRKLKTLRSDNGGEWSSQGAEDWQVHEGFKWQKTVPGVSAQNGQAERAIRSVQGKMCSMLIGRACRRELWPHAITAAAHVMNLTPSATKSILHEVFYRTTAHKLVQQLRVFGCLAWVHVQWKDQQGKYRARAEPAIMIGYYDEHKAWKFCNPDQPASIQWSNSATFHEDKGWSDRQQKVRKPTTAVEVEEENVTPVTTAEEETRSEAAVEDLLPVMDSAVGAANTAVLNLDPSLGEAMNGEDAQLWKEAICKELEGLEAMGTWEVVHHPQGVPLVDSKVVLRLKLDADGVPIKHKARLVARGFTQREGIDYQETFSPVAPLGAIRAILALAVQNNWEVHTLDITMAYLNSTLKEAIYMKPPEGSGVAPGQVYKVVKGLYGLKQSRREWNLEFDRSLQRIGFFQVECAPCIYTKGHGEDLAIVVIYVDDTLVIAPQLETVLKVKKQIGQRWKMEDSGEVSHFLGIKISRDRMKCTMTIGQSGYIDQVLAKHLDRRTRPTTVPMKSIPEGTIIASKAQQKEYPVIVGKLLWIANSTRPDLSHTVSVLARHMREPSQEHYQAAQRVLRYLEGTKEVGIVYRVNELQEPLVAHSDANWASDATIQRKSTSGSVAFVYGNPVTWKSATQKCASLSAVEAEFIAATEATREVLFLKQLLRSIGIATSTPTVYLDNTGCIQVSKDPAQHWKLKHIDTKYHFVHNNVQEGRVQIKYMDTKRNLADVLTKPVRKQAIQQARFGLRLQTPTAAYETRFLSYTAILKRGVAKPYLTATA
ncbi:related to retrotransposon protein [Ustilago sp. UG-2017b]|nr:related to retrotransposon protein [Ustilago sp. UG-2017b]